MKHYQKKSGFTLIELLVVVLIIGILSAVALPQYQVAVTKSRLATLIPVVSSLVTNLDMYYLANGTYPTSSDGNFPLDIALPAGCVQDQGAINVSCGINMQIDIMTSNPVVLGCLKKEKIGYIKWANVSAHPNIGLCLAGADNTVANQVCRSMGGAESNLPSDSFSAYCLNGAAAKVYLLP